MVSALSVLSFFRARSVWIAALLGFAAALTFALVSDIRWEDYYITYRTSRNLVDGHGLVFQPGERVHTFTSPLGVLLPAACLWLTGGDESALWLFRVLSAAALGLAASFVADIARRTRLGPAAIVLALGCTIFEAKTLTFSVSGMETAFMLLFLMWTLRTLLVGAEQRWRQLGAAFAGLMWTRPDGCVFIAALGFAYVLFSPSDETVATPLLRCLITRVRPLLLAGLVCTALYLPWFIFAWRYYGSPVPNTVVAKALTGEPKTLLGFLVSIVQFPVTTLRCLNFAGHGWLPHYFGIGGWPLTMAWPARALDLLVATLWVLPFVRWEARLLSFAAAAVLFYLNYFPLFVFPWYLPPPHWLGVLALALLVQQTVNAARRLESAGIAPQRLRSFYATTFLATAAAAASVVGLSALVCHQLGRAQQLVENGVRRPMGLWLREHAQPGDTVALEPLGYVGYYSQLKTYDYMGLSSREVTQIRHDVAWSPEKIVRDLRPTWVVERLLPDGTEQFAATRGSDYVRVTEFEQSKAIRAHNFPGRAYLEFDAHFVIYRRR